MFVIFFIIPTIVPLMFLMFLAGMLLAGGQVFVNNINLLLKAFAVLGLLYCVGIWFLLIKKKENSVVSTICSATHLYGANLLFQDMSVTFLQDAVNSAYFPILYHGAVAAGIWLFLEWLWLGISTIDSNNIHRRGINPVCLILGTTAYLIVIKVLFKL